LLEHQSVLNYFTLDMADAATEASQPALFKKRNKPGSTIRKRPITPPPASDESDFSSSEDEATGQRIKRRKPNKGIVGASTATSSAGAATSTGVGAVDGLTATKHAASTSTDIAFVNDATRAADWYEEQTGNLSATQLLGSSSRKGPSTPTDIAATDVSNGTYRGQSSYGKFIAKNPNAPTSKAFGPTKAAASNVRMVTVTDFAPDVCKDYKQTGFCGFGDSCKYLHAREDYAAGWQLDKEWEKVGGKAGANSKAGSGNVTSTRGGAEGKTEEEEAEDKLLEKIPFACIICKQPYKFPIITKCGHYFCEKCALERYKKTPNCAACGAGTGGVFNGAKGLKKLLERKKEREEKRREAGEEVGGEGDGDGDGGEAGKEKTKPNEQKKGWR